MKSVSKAIQMFPAVGWIRGSSVDSSALLQQINDIRTENEELKKKLHETIGDSVFEIMYEFSFRDQ